MTSNFTSPVLGSSFGTMNNTLSRSQQLSQATLKKGPHKTMFFPKSAHPPVMDNNSDDKKHKKGSSTPKNTASTASITAKYGGTYCGDWIENKREGYGTQIFKSGLRYEGMWSNDRMEGEGVMYNTEGKVIYRGEYMNSKQQGYGTAYDDNGDIYEGDWNQGLRTGEGRLKYGNHGNKNSKDNSAIYVGHFEANQRSGQGTITYPNGDAYIGEWLNDVKNGSGRYLYASKRMIFIGEWLNDQSICGEMRDMTEEEILDSTASAVTSNTAVRGELPPLYLADPYGVIATAAVTAHSQNLHQEPSSSLAMNNNDDNNSLPNAASYGAAYDISAASLGISEEDLDQLAYAFTTGVNYASSTLGTSTVDNIPVGCIPADVRILTEIFSTLGIYASEQEVDNVLNTMLTLQEQQQNSSNALMNGLLNFTSFATCMATQR